MIPDRAFEDFDKPADFQYPSYLMRTLGLVFWLLALATEFAPAAQVVTQEITVITGITESTIVGLLQVTPIAGESGASVAVPMLLPQSVAASPATSYAAAQPSLSIGSQSFTPTTFHNSGLEAPGTPRGWQAVVFQFQIPPQFAGRGFVGKLMYVQPQIKNVIPFFPLTTPAGSASKVTFLPGNSHMIQLVSQNSQPAVLEDGMLTLQPRDRELILVRRIEVREKEAAVEEKKSRRGAHFVWKNPFNTSPKRKVEPTDTPQPILPR
jgi:hypothetical protein